MRVVGACMMETNTVAFPVCILFSRCKKLLMIYAHDVCMATLETDLYDSAFGNCKWEDFVHKKEAVWTKNWRKEAAVAGRNVGFDRLPQFMAGDDDMHAVRYGVVSFMNLRTVKNSSEMNKVTNALMKTLAVIPMGNTLAMEAKDCRCIRLAAVFETGYPILPNDISPENPSKLRSWSDQISRRVVLTEVSSIILQHAYDDSTDVNGEFISEIGFQMSPHRENSKVIEEASAVESAVLLASMHTKTTELQACNDKPPTLPHAMENVRSNYSTRLLADCDEIGVKKAMETVSSVIFSHKDASRIASVCCATSSPTLTITSALCVLGRCLVEKQALVIATRETDGRLVSIKAVGSTRTIERVDIKSFRRYVISPWATVLIVDRSRILYLEIREPDNVACDEMRKEKLRLKDEDRTVQASNIDIGDLKQKIETLSSSLLNITQSLASFSANLEVYKQAHFTLKKVNDDKEACIKDLTRKVDYLVTQTAETLLTPLEPTASDETLKSLKRTLTTLQDYDKRFRAD